MILLSFSVITFKIHCISKAGSLKCVTCGIITKTLYFQNTVPSFECLGCLHVCTVISVTGGHSINSVCQVWSVMSLVLEMGVAHVTNPACICIHSLMRSNGSAKVQMSYKINNASAKQLCCIQISFLCRLSKSNLTDLFFEKPFTFP